MLLMFPAIWSILIVSKEEIDIYLILLFIYGSFIMRSAGCIINDIIDKNFDKRVKRTKFRPLASENLDISDAIILFIVFLSIGLSILLSLNSTCILLGFIAFPLIMLYPLMKRFTYFPQLFLAIVFNFSVLISWTAATGRFDNQSLLLYLACIFWTLGYDTIYAHQDREDDALIGVKSSALFLGDKTKLFLVAFYCTTLSGLLAIGLLNNFGVFFFSLIVISGIQLVWQILTLDINSPINCLKKFKSNRLFGLIVTVAIYSG